MQISVLVSSWCSAYVLFAPSFADLHLRSMKKNWGHASKGGQILDTKIETTNETTNETLQFCYDVQRKLILCLDSLDLFDFWDCCVLVTLFFLPPCRYHFYHLSMPHTIRNQLEKFPYRQLRSGKLCRFLGTGATWLMICVTFLYNRRLEWTFGMNKNENRPWNF